jgi:hypothetical protein
VGAGESVRAVGVRVLYGRAVNVGELYGKLCELTLNHRLGKFILFYSFDKKLTSISIHRSN